MPDGADYSPTMRRTGMMITVAVAFTLVAAGCGDSDSDAQPVVTTTTVTATTVTTTTVAVAAAPVQQSGIVTITTADGEALAATIELPAGPSADTALTVVMAHMRGADRSTWDPVIDDLTSAGHATLAFDFRGYGDSTGARDTNLDVDLAAAVEQARANSTGPVVLIGASMGGTAALDGGAALGADGVIVMSAPANFLGLDGGAGAGRLDVPLLLLVSQNDQPYVGDLTAIAAATGAELVTFEGSAHGTNIFSTHDADATTTILDFLADIA